MMVLERMLENLALTVEPFSLCEVSSGWRLRFPALDPVTLHFVLRGDGAFRAGNGTHVPIERFTLVVVPPGVPHALERGDVENERVAARAPRPGASLHTHAAGPAGDRALLVACGRIRATAGGGIGLFDMMRAPRVLDFSGSEDMRLTFKRLLEEQRSDELGSSSMAVALMSECLVLLFRRLLDEPRDEFPWWQAGDPRLARAMAAIVREPQRRFSLELLADEALMSRSVFAKRFLERFGRTPMTVVREVRLRRAAELLRTTDLSVRAIASRVGYASRSHFSSTFRAHLGVSPARFRAVSR